VPFGDAAALAQALAAEPAGVACVIIEQPPQIAPDGYWAQVQTLCWESGTLLVLDEVVTGFRFGLGGAAERFRIAPDIAVYGKGLGNGIPISAMVFPREMACWFSRNDPVFVSSTHFGCTLGLAAADYILEHWTAQDVEYLWGLGATLMTGLQQTGLTVTGYPPVSLIQYPSNAWRGAFIAGMCQRGILMNRPNIVCRAHTQRQVEVTIAAARAVKEELEQLDAEAWRAVKAPQVLFSNR
jgi:glutamate-1-semialdehyde aminotransferase